MSQTRTLYYMLQADVRSAYFNADNDHNPLVPAKCPKCGGAGRWGATELWGGRPTEVCGNCDACGGSGEADGLVPLFDNDAPAIEATLRPDGWIKCPGCGKSFSTADPYRWTGLRHVTCGQKIALTPPAAETYPSGCRS